MLPEIREKRIPLCTGSSGCGHQLNVGGYAGSQTLMLGKIAGRRRKGQQRRRWLDGIMDSMNMSLSKLRGMVKDRKAWRAAVHEVAELDTTEPLNNTTTRFQARASSPEFCFSGSMVHSGGLSPVPHLLGEQLPSFQGKCPLLSFQPPHLSSHYPLAQNVPP